MSTASVPASELGGRDLRYQLNAAGCPHPESRRASLIQLSEGGEAIDLCQGCYALFQEFKSRWLNQDISTREIRARMLRRGYSDRDVRDFILGLEEAA